ncbi:MAG: hypothetical protein GVY36_03215 [Verrucomicrobia bacterium]|jgi:preprotein translocase subunit SecA|nr:hypothetical protein [Verrucomicrobiota bacterium]
MAHNTNDVNAAQTEKQLPFRPPSLEARRTENLPLDPVPQGLDALVHDWAGMWHSRAAKSRSMWARAVRMAALREELAAMPERPFKADLRAFREQVRRAGGFRPELVEPVLPYMAEAARRSLGLTAYPTQLMGALAISHGALVEMATGEGKTLTIALAAAIAGFTGKPCHVITANDYLAGRDAQDLERFYQYCGLTTAAINAEMDGAARRQAYRTDVVYCTGKEIVADHLRDQITLGPQTDARRRAILHLLRGKRPGDQIVLRGLHTAIVDEADNQLIDEAVTPLIISRKQENTAMVEACAEVDTCASGLLPGVHYEVIERFKEVRLLPEGRESVDAWCAGQTGLLAARDWVADLVTQALQARHFFLRDKQYVMVDGKVVIVDEFTGRLMPGRSWRLGLHQAVEAKEGSTLSDPTETLARLSFQNFYRYFPHLAGITGTAREARREVWRIYRLPLIQVPYHRPNQRSDWRPHFFTDEDAKWAAIVDEIEREHRLGRPVLVGTRSVAASEHLGRLLESRGLLGTILNAVRHQEEARIVRRAGDPDAITIATNMAGRGTDIRLGQGVAKKGGLHVILTEGHESARVDRQLRGRAARQGAPGSTHLVAAFTDELIQRHLPALLCRMLARWISLPLPGRQRILAWGFRRAQKRAERRGRRQRLLLMKQDQDTAKALIGGGKKA